MFRQNTSETNYLSNCFGSLFERKKVEGQRGGAYSGSDPSVPATRNHPFHYYHSVYLNNSSGNWEAANPTGFGGFQSIVQDKMAMVSQFLDEQVDLPFRFGEVCIRTIWYPGGKFESYGSHEDSCFLSIPILDSALTDGTELDSWFFGAMAQPFGYKPKAHCFKKTVVPRVYMVAFVQLGFGCRLPDGWSYREVLEGRVKKNYN